jgi:nitroreductase
MATFEQLLKIRRSVRNFTDQSVPLALIRTLIEDSTLAPNASNEQPWQFAVVRDKAYMKRISDESKKNILERIRIEPQTAIARYEAALRNESFNVFYNAPCLVIIAGPSEKNNIQADCALAACYFMMAAASRGLGTCWINLGAYIEDPAMRGELGLSAETKIVAPIIVGYPKEIPSVPPRKPPEIVAVIEESA